MPDSNILIYITGELAILLLVICAFLVFHVSGLKKLIRKLEEKIIALRKAVGKSRKEAKQVLKQLAAKEKIKPKKFLDYLDEEIHETREHHQSLQPDRDIVLDISPDAPLDRQAASLRHAFLIAEKEARYAGGEDASSWDVLQAKLQQIIQFYETSQPESEPGPELEQEVDLEPVSLGEEIVAGDSRAEEVANYKKRIENLERFKKLFFEMEGKWEASKNQADEYYQQLQAMGQDLGAGDEFEKVLEHYSRAFDGVADLLAEGGELGDKSPEDQVVDTDRDGGTVGGMVVANQEEIHRLKNMAVDQHKVITELKKKLYDAASPEEQQQVVEELSVQLEKQQRFLKEAESCTQLIENELSRTMQENEELRGQLGEATGSMDEAEVAKLETLISDLTNESKEMLGTIATLEQENATLKQKIDAGSSAGDPENIELLKDKLGTMQQELLNLQTQHIELEERYLELKMK